MNLLPKDKNKIILSQLIIIHIVGVIGLNINVTKNIFQHLSAFNLLLSAIIIHYYMQKKDINLYAFYAIVFSISMIAEIIGVNTGLLFGNYYYTKKLTCLVLGVPFIIGINWIVLTICTAKLTDYFNFKSIIINIIIGAVLMVLLDVLLEFFAIKHQLWVWNGRHYPTIKNFLGWFIVSMFTHLIYRVVIKNNKNEIAVTYFFILVLFLIVDLCCSMI